MCVEQVHAPRAGGRRLPPPGSSSALLHSALVPERLTYSLLHWAPRASGFLLGLANGRKSKRGRQGIYFAGSPPVRSLHAPFRPRRDGGQREVPAQSFIAPYTQLMPV